MKYVYTNLLLLAFVFSAWQCVAQYNPAPTQVSFESVLKQGFENNYGIRLQNLALEKQTYISLQANGFITPYFTFNLSSGDGIVPTLKNDGTNIFETNFVYPTRPGIDVYSGTHLESTQELSPPESITFFNTYGGWLGIRMPLLRGLGDKSMANAAINSAAISEQASSEQLSNEVMTYFRNLFSAYLSLKHDVLQYAILSEALEEARQYKQFIYTLVDYEELPKVEKNRTDALVIQQEQQLSSVKLNAFNSYYNLRLLTGVSDSSLIQNVPAVTSIVPKPDMDQVKSLVQKHSSVDDATIMQTPIYKNVELLTQASKVQLDTAENQKLDQLDLDVKFSWFEMTTDAQFEEAFGSSYPGKSVFLTLKYKLPVNEDQQNGTYLSQLVDYKSNKINLQKLLFETKTQIQRILISLEQLAALYERDKKLVAVQKQSYLNEKEKFKLGSATQIDVILSFENYYESTLGLNDLQFKIHDTIVQLKFLLGELPANEEQLNTFSLENYFISY